MKKLFFCVCIGIDFYDIILVIFVILLFYICVGWKYLKLNNKYNINVFFFCNKYNNINSYLYDKVDWFMKYYEIDYRFLIDI